MRKIMFAVLFCLGLGIISCTDEFNFTEPEPIGFIKGPEQIEGPWGFVLKDKYAYLADGRNGFVVVDISDSENTKVVSHLESETYTCPRGVCHQIMGDIIIDSDYAYLRESGDELIIVDITDPTATSRVSNFSIEHNSDVSWNDMVLSGNHLFVSSRENVLKVIDVTDRSNPIDFGTFQTDDPKMEMRDLAVVENYVYIATKTKDSEAIPYEMPVTVNNETRLESGVYFEDLYGLMILDIADPATPKLVHEIQTDEDIESFVFEGDYAYMLLEQSLQIFDISDPEVPNKVGSYQTEAWAWKITKHKNHIYIANVNRIYVIDVTDPKNPFAVQSYKTSVVGGNSSFDLAINDKFLYFSGTFNPTKGSDITYGLTILDLELYPSIEDQS